MGDPDGDAELPPRNPTAGEYAKFKRHMDKHPTHPVAVLYKNAHSLPMYMNKEAQLRKLVLAYCTGLAQLFQDAQRNAALPDRRCQTPDGHPVQSYRALRGQP